MNSPSADYHGGDRPAMAMNPALKSRLVKFLREDLAIPEDAIAIALHHREASSVPLVAMVLRQYGLITLEQLDQVFDWMEQG